MGQKHSKAFRGLIRDLRAHTEPYVTVGELAQYWLVSRKQIYKQIDAGTLHAIKLGPRLLRISTPEAIAFEQRANLYPPKRESHAETPQHAADLELRVRKR